jgi:hypothetical protein
LPTHDATRVATLLREILVGDRNRVGFLLGAGCPVSIQIEQPAPGPLVPDVAGLTDCVLQSLAESAPKLKAKLDAYLEIEGIQGKNIEVILSRVRAMHDIVGAGLFNGFTAAELGDLNSRICGKIADRVSVALPDGPNGYRNLASWIKGAAREYAVEVFTTNYDLLVEQAFEEARVTLFDGFTGSRLPFFDVAAIEGEAKIPPRWTRLWKLHGSINWRESIDTVNRVTETGNMDCALIHPSHRKYDQSRRLPYLALMDRMRVFLRRPSAVLITVGYSFRDQHINEMLVEGLEQNPTAAVFALQYGKLSSYDEARTLAKGTSGLSVYAEDQATIGTQEGTWSVPAGVDIAVLTGIFDSPTLEDEAWEGGAFRMMLGDFSNLGPFLLQVTGISAQAKA